MQWQRFLDLACQQLCFLKYLKFSFDKRLQVKKRETIHLLGGPKKITVNIFTLFCHVRLDFFVGRELYRNVTYASQ